MNSVETIRGANNGKGKPIKAFPEKYEINLRKVVGDNLVGGHELEGEPVHVCKDLDKLVFDIMEFYENKKI